MPIQECQSPRCIADGFLRAAVTRDQIARRVLVPVRLAWRRLNFAVDSESHYSPLPLPFCRMRPLARGALTHAIRDRPDFSVLSTKVKQRLPFANHHILNISDKDSVVSCVLC